MTAGMEVDSIAPSHKKEGNTSILEVPISKGVRPWKKPRSYPASAVKNRTIKTSWEKKQKQRMRRKAVQELAREAKKADAEAKEAERKRRAAKRKRKEENEEKSTKKQIITNPNTLKRMSKKAFLHLAKK